MLQPMAAANAFVGTPKGDAGQGLPTGIHVDLPAGTSDDRGDPVRQPVPVPEPQREKHRAAAGLQGRREDREYAAGKALADVLQAKKDARDEIIAGCGVPPRESWDHRSREPRQRHRRQPAGRTAY